MVDKKKNRNDLVKCLWHISIQRSILDFKCCKNEELNLFVELTDKEITNIEIIDKQHANFVKIISELYELLGQNRPETIKYLLNQLVDETRIHFETEEKFMKEHNFSSYFSHKLEHDRFYSKVKNIRDKVFNGSEKVNLEMLKSFKLWLINHIALNDKKLGEFLVENNYA